ncbi:MAG: tRNA threonylcarbamoyladenosine dehydratase [Lachnospiraceae bacterium]|jgi:tRNA A37 threonylcarbamoyladenosine dehydratase
MEMFSRTALLLGTDAIKKLQNSRVAVFGLGGVGGYVCEALVRSGVGAFDIIDNDIISESNINRQIIATTKTVGKYKTEVMAERMKDINPEADIRARNCFFLPETASEFDFSKYDYVVDAVDTVTAKLEIIMRAKANNIPVISSMGAGNKLDPTAFKVADIYDTKVCPLAKTMRRELKKRNISELKVVYSEEIPVKAEALPDEKESSFNRRSIPGSTAFVPSVAGLIIAGEVIKDLISCEGE